MIFMFTGQPGHGKTLFSLQQALDFKAKGRTVYACNVRQLDYDKTGFLPMTLEEFKRWHTDIPDGSVIWVDECYMPMPKRGPSVKVPAFVDELARHRHRGLDFIFVAQSPSTQVDSFVHDLIEEHYHIRRRYGLPFVHVRRFDRYERNPEKALPLTTSRKKYPSKLFGLYKSTELDTTQRRIPWFYFAVGGLAIAAVLAFFNAKRQIFNRTTNDTPVASAESMQPGSVGIPKPGYSGSEARTRGTATDYVAALQPRVPGQPWSAPIYDSLSVPGDPPRVFCMEAGEGVDAFGDHQSGTCGCKTEQGTRYSMPYQDCVTVARHGQYEPFLRQAPAQASNAPERRSEASGASSGGSVVPFRGTVISQGVNAAQSFPEVEQVPTTL